MLQLLETNASDLPVIMAMERDPSASGFICPYTDEEHREVIGDTGKAHLTIKDEQGQIIGFIILLNLNNKNKSLVLQRIVIAPKNKGYGRMAIEQLKQYVFEQLQAHRFWLDVFEDNARARHLYRKLGFVEEGLLREAILTETEPRNLVIMSILKREYFGR